MAIEVVGHRGCAGLLPENTLLGFRRALALGVDRIECDVHLSSDERLVVIHDERVDRTTNGTGAVAEQTFAQLRELDAGRGERIPTLDEVLGVIGAAGMPLLLELKGEGTAEPALQAVRARGLLAMVTFTCFDFERIVEVRGREPAAQTGAIFAKADAGSPAAAAAAGACGMGAQFRSLTAEIIAEAHRIGVQVRAWNPDAEEDQRAAVALGPDGIATNRPDRLLALLGRGAAV